MRDTELYRHLLGLVTPWEVERVDLSVEDGRVDVWVKHPKRTRFACPDSSRSQSGQANRVRLGCFTHTSTRPSSTDRSTRSTSHGVTSPSRWRYSSVSRIPQSCRRPADQSQTGPTENSEAPIFEVPVKGRPNRQPITRAGRFAHEAVSFDPVGGSLYLTEDNFAFASGFYRYTPRRNPMVAGRLDNDGQLEMLAVKDQRNAHLEGHQEAGATYEVKWVPIVEPDKVFPYTAGETANTPNDTAIVFVGDQGRELGAASFSRLEGQVYDDGVVYFTSTQGGGAPESGPHNGAGFGNGSGQVWAYDTRNETLSLVYESPDRDTLDLSL